MTRMSVVAIALWVVAITAPPAPAHGQPLAETAPGRDITQLSGDLYEARDGQQYTVFLVTPDGIIVGDPLNTAFARWLKDELAVRFAGRAIRYVLFSHHHFDRSEGGDVFAPGAALVGHSAFNGALSNARLSASTFLGVQDRNRNGRFDPDELRGPDAALVLSRDRNRDGIVTPNELYGQVYSVKSSYGATRTITLGGKNVVLVHSGPWHSPDMTVLFFPEERMVFAVNPPPVTVVPFSFGDGRPDEVYDWLHAVVSLDFDTLVFDDGRTVAAIELRRLADYLDELRVGIVSGYERGQTLAEIQATPLPQNHQGIPHDSGRAQQISDVYRTLRLRRFALSVVGLANYGSRTTSFCSAYSFCTGGGMVPGGAVAASFLLGRRVGVIGEVALSGQSWSTRQQPLYDEETALRQTRTSAMLRFAPAPAFALFGGPTVTIGDVRGSNVVRGRLVPVGGRHAIHERDFRIGVTGGLEVRAPFGGRTALVVPIRVLYFPSDVPDYWPSRLEVNAGLGMTIRVRRSVN